MVSLVQIIIFYLFVGVGLFSEVFFFEESDQQSKEAKNTKLKNRKTIIWYRKKC